MQGGFGGDKRPRGGLLLPPPGRPEPDPAVQGHHQEAHGLRDNQEEAEQKQVRFDLFIDKFFSYIYHLNAYLYV